MAAIAITESPNELTDTIHTANPIEILRLLRQCDGQMFHGYRHHAAICEYVPELETAASHVAACLASPSNSKVILTGSGTSGRMAFLIARQFNRLAGSLGLPSLFRYSCAGGDVALFASREAPEDDWQRGAAAVTEMSRGCHKVVVIGITCGLSAPFVGGQLQLAMDSPETYTPILLGFNTVDQARNIAIEGCDWTFKDVVLRMQTQGGLILNPGVGPEAVTGSTRMKGGSATKLLLEIVMLKAFALLQQQQFNLASALGEYQLATTSAYSAIPALAQVITMAHQALQANGHIYYVGDSIYGIEALIDASECPPTYNAKYGDVRAYLHQGFATLDNIEGDLAAGGDPDLQLGTSSLLAKGLAPQDLVVFVGATMAELEHPINTRVLDIAKEAGAPTVRVLVESAATAATESNTSAVDVHVVVPSVGVVPTSHLCELAMKLILNAVSTGAYVLLGKVLSNRMIDLQVGAIGFHPLCL
jgi:N-acetylmuramic acid 6-phosphate (MurNAc-6-P) etherase